MLRSPTFITGLPLRRSHCTTLAPSGCARAQRHHCSTLGQIQAVFKALRQAKGVRGGTVRLCITEDMRVIVEHQPLLEGGAQTFVQEVAAWHGTFSTTVREAIGHLHPSDELRTSTSPLQSSLTAPVSPTGATIVDLTRVNYDEIRCVMMFMDQRYPQLRLLLRHTSGRDLQGTQLHTATAELVPRGMGVLVTSLTADLQRLTEVFKGEAVGQSYLGCVRRALRDAFSAAGLVYPSSSMGTTTAVSVLSLYAEAWSSDGFSLHLVPDVSPDHVECTLRHGATGKSLASTALALTSEGLRTLLKFCDATTAEHYADRHASIQQRLRSTPLHLVLPRSHLRVKHLLRRLLLYYYGIGEEAVIFRAEVLSGSMHRVQVQVRLDLSNTVNIDDGFLGFFVLGKATGSSKSSTVELATVQALQTVFPDVFESEIAYHPEVRAILESDRATASDDAPPSPGQGLENQLRWALQRQNASFILETVMLKPNSTHPEWGITTGANSVWVSQLYIVQGTTNANATDTAKAGAAASHELCCCAFDGRKARSEQKAMAAALAQRFPDLCRRSVEQAREKHLIDAGGTPAPCAGVRGLQDANVNVFAAALSSDPFLRLLDPRKCAEPQPLSAVHTADSTLERYWRATKANGSFLGSIGVMREASRAVYVARCVRAGDVCDAQGRVIAVATGSTEIGALFALLRSMQELPEVVSRDTSTPVASESSLVADLPLVLPDASPLQTCAQAIARLYGLHCTVCIRLDGLTYVAELWSKTPAESALLEAHSRLSKNPFAADRVFYLGRGHASTPFVAAIRAAQQVFETHIRAHHRAFDEEVLMRGKMRLQPDTQGCLVCLCDAVVAEIKSTSDRIVSDNWLLFTFEHDQLSDLSFHVASGKRSVVLEHSISKDLLSCARELANRISHETSDTFLSPARVSGVDAQTAEQLLCKLCLQAYGLTLQTDTCQRGQMWHCRLSVLMSEEIAYCIAQASGLRKRDTVEAAAVAALREYFVAELPHIHIFATLPAVAALESPNKNTSAETPTKSWCETYAFRVSETASALESASGS
ncbi:hypothetical protein NXY56_003483 [Leishmania guyanensis]|uniref:Uncharacterized protein n=1 Tax=Leishmania guyanensis TaxID=5670 RepID=A0A1E1IXN0_LEIGU|nr:hypothetical protein, conserved [Leishmania guyanensis]